MHSNPKPVLRQTLLLLPILLLLSLNLLAQSRQPIALKCEYLSNPIGIDVKYPRLTWQLKDDRQGAIQTAYQLFVSTDSLQKSNFWQSVKVNSAANLITYNGKPLQPFTKYYWKVLLWDQNGKPTAFSAINSFETGMMGMQNWHGSWISDGFDIHKNPAPYFRKTFNLAKTVRSARAYIAAAGLYELYINGSQTGNHRLDPSYTRFDRRNLYVSYDVTAQIRSGKNAIGVVLGNGWYNFQSIGVWDFERAPWRNRPTFCMDLHITYTDGSSVIIKSDTTWRTSSGPIIHNSIYTGEHYDARLEQPGWNTANFDDTKWAGVTIRATPSQNVVAQALEPIRNVEKLSFKTMNKVNDTDYVFDLGRNIAGITQITLDGDSNTIVRLTHAEKLFPNGHVDQNNIAYFLDTLTAAADPYGVDIYKLNGKGPQSFMPHFNYKGFQYVEVTGNKPLNLHKDDIAAYFTHSDVVTTGSIKTSSELVNKIFAATNASYLSNLYGYPTDCPQREKNGWTGDAQIASETGLYSYDAVTIYEKWMADHRDEQQPNGVLPSIIPTGSWGYAWGNGPDWTSTIAIIPWNIYLFYGDPKLLSDCYDNIRRYVDHINEAYPTGLTDWGLGDWCPVKSTTPVELTSSVYYYVDADILVKAAKILGKTADHDKYAALANKIKTAINTKYLNKATGIYADGNQTEQSFPLFWGLVPHELIPKVTANLAKDVVNDNYHLDAGILGAKAILNALSENGYADVAYKLAAQDTYPSWGWWIVNGATTLHENWDPFLKVKWGASLNHIMFGEIGAWLYKGLGGIKPDESQPGFKNILLSPNFVEGLDHFEATHTGPYGKITSSWKREGKTVKYSVTVPANSTAAITFTLVSGKKVYQQGKELSVTGGYKVGSGSYEFEIR